jgi:8-oxo-dGTP pyrophosphatase MutT (NUDIX family)
MLPNPGGWLDQPAKFLEAMMIITAEKAAIRKELEEEANKNIGRR